MRVHVRICVYRPSLYRYIKAQAGWRGDCGADRSGDPLRGKPRAKLDHFLSIRLAGQLVSINRAKLSFVCMRRVRIYYQFIMINEHTHNFGFHTLSKLIYVTYWCMCASLIVRIIPTWPTKRRRILWKTTIRCVHHFPITIVKMLSSFAAKSADSVEVVHDGEMSSLETISRRRLY